jgi:hypothetical protein
MVGTFQKDKALQLQPASPVSRRIGPRGLGRTYPPIRIQGSRIAQDPIIAYTHLLEVETYDGSSGYYAQIVLIIEQAETERRTATCYRFVDSKSK